MAGIDDVARHAGVSTATVSRALSGRGYVSDATREKVAQAAQELDYVVSSNASSLASGRTRNVGVVVPSLNHWFFASVVEGAESALLRHGYDLTLYNLTGGGDERKSVFEHFLLRQRVDAVIAIGLELTEAEVSSLHAMDKPLIGIGGAITDVFSLTMDDVAVSRLATEHLLSLGHTRIAHIGGGKEFDRDFHLPSKRRIGYEGALTDAGVTPDPALFRPADFTLPGGYEAAKQLLGSPRNRPTAIVASSDEMAIGSILAARDLGLHVPQDVSIVGIDDHELSTFFGLTTVAQFPLRQGEQAVEALMEYLEPDKDAPASAGVPLYYELIVRSSTARPPE
ncbi:LacI family DNA-binding transcriptional regulator [Mycetocola zhujimingii]|uniref:LacI family DNA-binding transcriptional regulator n=1 Tax=Mycetocola zhujimingii TaxID=2079792 RepID=UPI000D380452|nr:LacI family DNA-binding transcriptional regulator [Mycetocola zhujimingii]AWB85497.1 LacI family transcriptional regulator [Mycetocola zhujimingii]